MNPQATAVGDEVPFPRVRGADQRMATKQAKSTATAVSSTVIQGRKPNDCSSEARVDISSSKEMGGANKAPIFGAKDISTDHVNFMQNKELAQAERSGEFHAGDFVPKTNHSGEFVVLNQIHNALRPSK